MSVYVHETLLQPCVAEREMRRSSGEGKGGWGGRGGRVRMSRGMALYIRPFISLLPSVIRNVRTPSTLFQFHLARDRRDTKEQDKRRLYYNILRGAEELYRHKRI